MMVHRNKSPFGRIGVVIFGVCQIFDGLVRILSLGTYSTTAPLDYSRHQSLAHLMKLKEQPND